MGRLPVLLLVPLLLLPAACAPGGEAPAAPSLLLVSIDTLRPDYLGFEGYDRDTSPFLDALFAEGVYFERAVSPIARTTPALASLLTGSYPHRSGVRTLTDALADDAVPLAQRLREAGYQTLAVVSNEVLTPERRLGRGFDVYDFRGSVRTAPATTRAALDLLGYLDPGRPFFAWVHYVDPHVPYHPPAELAERFDPGYAGRYRLRFGYQPRDGEPVSAYRTFPEDLPKSIATHRNPLPAAVNAHLRRLYAGDVRATDEAVRALVEGVRAADRDPLLVVTADHGESLGEHDFYFDHGDYVYNAGTRVPLAFVFPRGHPLRRSGRCAQWVSLVDVAPTLVELLPARRSEEGFEGRSLLPCLRGQALPPEPVFAESGHAFFPELVRGLRRNDVSGRFRAVIHEDWKLIWTPFQAPERAWQLFDLAADPHETRDLYRPDHPRLAPLREALFAWTARAPAAEPPRPPSAADRERLRALGYLE